MKYRDTWTPQPIDSQEAYFSQMVRSGATALPTASSAATGPVG